MHAAKNLAETVGVKSACSALKLPRASYYRHHRPTRQGVRARPRPPLALSPIARQEVLETLHSPRFVDRAPPQVVASLLDQDHRYLCSARTMYRILESEGELRERRNQLRHPAYQKPELLATGPNEVWTWDVTKLKGPVKWSYFYLYVILDLYSRLVVGWMVARRETKGLAKQLIAETVSKHGVSRDQLTLHADRGPVQTAKSVAFLLTDLGIAKSHNRPYTSNDNPYSEAQFKTLKYHPWFPSCFGSLEDARAFCRRFVAWYNTEHHHSSLAYLSPAEVHYGLAEQILAQRAEVLRAAFAAHPQRFKGRVPNPGSLPEEVWINPPATEETISTQKSESDTGGRPWSGSRPDAGGIGDAGGEAAQLRA